VVPCRSPPAMTPAPHRATRILVAEDDGEMRRLVTTALRHQGYEVVEESDGGRLLLRVAAMHATDDTTDIFDLIVTDNRMPVCNGLSIVHVLRAAKLNTPVVVITAFGDDETRARVRTLGAVLLDKPFKIVALISLVEQLLSSPLLEA
jgi:DNA-binding response OmpR family regulator